MNVHRGIIVSVGLGLVVGWFVVQSALTAKPATQPAAVPASVPVSDKCLLWKVELPGRGWNSPVVLTRDLAIFHSGGDRKIYAVARADGKPKWEFETGCAMSTVALLGDKLIGLGYDKIGPVALEAASGKVLWRSKNGYDHTYAADNTLISNSYTHNPDGLWVQRIHRLSPEDGTVVWTKKVTDYIGGSPIARSYVSMLTADVCLIGVGHGKDEQSLSSVMVAIDPATGKKMWAIDGINSAWFIRDGRVYVYWQQEYNRVGVTKAYDLKTGLEKKTTVTYDHDGYSQLAGDYLLSHRAFSAELEAYDFASGKRVWHYKPRGAGEVLTKWPGLMYTSTVDRFPVAMHDGAVLLIVNDGLLAVDLKTGKPRWKFTMECTNLYGLVVRDGIAYVMDDGYPIRDQRIKIHARRGDPPTPKSTCYLYALDLTKASQLGVPPEYEAATPK